MQVPAELTLLYNSISRLSIVSLSQTREREKDTPGINTYIHTKTSKPRTQVQARLTAGAHILNKTVVVECQTHDADS